MHVGFAASVLRFGLVQAFTLYRCSSLLQKLPSILYWLVINLGLLLCYCGPRNLLQFLSVFLCYDRWGWLDRFKATPTTVTVRP